MKNLYQNIFIPALLACNVCFAQAPKIKTAPNQVVVDGSITEWANLNFDTDKKAKVDYLIAKDDNNIYLALKTTDQVRVSSILGSGLTWSINTEGKKSKQYSMTFPLTEKKDKDNQEEYMNLIPEQIIAKIAMMKQRLINVKGFKDIQDNELSALNPYGIKAAVNFDENTGLSYEVSIPLSLFKENKSAGNDWAFNIKINGLQKMLSLLLT
jgi:hypothetical protein